MVLDYFSADVLFYLYVNMRPAESPGFYGGLVCNWRRNISRSILKIQPNLFPGSGEVPPDDCRQIGGGGAQGENIKVGGENSHCVMTVIVIMMYRRTRWATCRERTRSCGPTCSPRCWRVCWAAAASSARCRPSPASPRTPTPPCSPPASTEQPPAPHRMESPC